MLKSSRRAPQDTVLNGVNALAGLFLLFAPWTLGFAQVSGANWNAWIVGAAIAVIALGALVALQQWEEWLNLVLGIWAIAAPWVLGFAAIQSAVAVHVIVGLIVAVLAAVELWMAHNRPMTTT